MTDTFTKAHSFRRGCLGKNGRVLFLLVNDQLANDRLAHTSVVIWDSGRFKPVTTTAWVACAAVFLDWPDAEFAVIGEQGQFLRVLGDGSAVEEHLLATPLDQPGIFKAATTLDGQLVAVGAGFCCVTVSRSDQRRDLSPRHLGMNTTGLGAGFEGIGGRSETDFIAVGWDGAIWHFDGSRWEPQASPTNLILSAVTQRSDGEYWACGQDGTMVRGRPGKWRALDTGIEDNLWSLVPFAGAIIAAASKQLFRFELDQDEPQVIGLESDPTSFYWLDAKREEVLLSTGAKNVVLVVPDQEIVID